MIRTLEAAMKQYSLVIAERELLRGTLRGSVKVLTDILSLTNRKPLDEAKEYDALPDT